MGATAKPPDTVLLFDGFRLDRRGLSRAHGDGQWTPIVLGSRALGVLAALAERSGEIVTRQTLMEAVWPDVSVEDSNLAVQMATLRRVLDEGRGGGSCIQTFIGRGYRFLPAVAVETDAPPEPAAPAPEIVGAFEFPPSPKAPAPTTLSPVAPRARAGPRQLAFITLLILAGLVLGTAVFRWAGDEGGRRRCRRHACRS